MKTLAVELDNELHAQLTMLSQVLNRPVKALMQQGVRDYVMRLTSDPEVSGKAEAMLRAIEDEAATKRQALTRLFESNGSSTEAKRPAKPAKATQT